MYLDFIYNNGTAFRKVVLPLKLRLASDAGDSFETAKEIGFGNYTGWASWLMHDTEDFYKIFLEEGENVRIQLSPKVLEMTIYDLRLFNASGSLVESSCSKIRIIQRE
jgi:hypothetical protein